MTSHLTNLTIHIFDGLSLVRSVYYWSLNPMPALKFEKKSVFELLADTIEAQIRQEGWKGLLPSGRDLAQQHKVSLPTVQKAIALLIERKVLISRGGKRRLEIKGQGQLSRAEGQPYEVLVLSTAPLTSYDVTISLGVQRLGQELKAAGHGYRFVDLSGVEGVARRKAAQAEITVSRPTHCVLMRPDAHVYAAAARHPAKLATMFSDLRVRRPTALGVRYGYLVDIALRHLCPLGHRRFFMPFLGRKTALRTSMQGIARAARKHGVSVQVMRTAQELTAENMAAALDRGLAEGTTAVLFPQWVDFMPAIAYFARKGLEFPRDLSVAALVGCALSERYSPPIAGCLSSHESIAKQTMLWIETGKVEDDVYADVYARTWQSGRSIGPALMKS